MGNFNEGSRAVARLSSVFMFPAGEGCARSSGKTKCETLDRNTTLTTRLGGRVQLAGPHQETTSYMIKNMSKWSINWTIDVYILTIAQIPQRFHRDSIETLYSHPIQCGAPQ